MSTIYITETDLHELSEMVHHVPVENGEAANLVKLRQELERARVVPAENLPRDVITMNSKVLLHDLDTHERETYTLVYPWHANADNHQVSVLAPIGTALIGARVGDVIQWPVPIGLLRFRIEELIFQPEREGAVMSCG